MKKLLTVLMVGSAFMVSAVTAHAGDKKDAKKETKKKEGEGGGEKKEGDAK